MKKIEAETVCPPDLNSWRQWLQDNHKTKQSVWLIYYKKNSKQASFSWSDAVDEALCFGWIDSKAKSVDEEKFMQFFSRRKPNGTWSKINKEKIKLLIETKRMTSAGFEAIETAKINGSWTLLDKVEELIIPKDLEQAFKALPGSKHYFTGLSKSVKKSILQWLVLAKTEKTREKRIQEIASCASQGKKPESFR